MAAVTEASDSSSRPDHDDARPEKNNFGDGQNDTEGKEQATFSRQC